MNEEQLALAKKNGIGKTSQYNKPIGPSPAPTTTQPTAAIKPTVPTPITPITPNDLGNTTAPLKLPTLAGSTATSGLGGLLESVLNNQKTLQAKLDADVKERSDALKDEKKGLSKTMQDLLNISDEQLRLEDKADISGKTQKVTDLTNKLESEQLALRREVERIRENKTGMLAGAVEDEVGRVERASLSKQADIALLHSAANRDLSTAQSIIDRKIELMTEPLKQKLEFDKFFYEENKDDLTKAEQKQFESMQKTDERTYETAKEELESIHETYKIAAENGASEDVLQQILGSQSSDDALSAAGSFLRDPDAPLNTRLKQAQLDKLLAENAATGATSGIAKLLGVANTQVLTGLPEKYKNSAFIFNDAEPDAADKELVKQMMTSISLLERMEEQYNRAVGDEYTGTGSGVGARVKGLLRFAGSAAGFSQEFTAYENLRGANLSLIARGLKGEKGTLSDGDVKRAKTSLPGKFSSPLEAKRAFDDLKAQVQENLNLRGSLVTTSDEINAENDPLGLLENDAINNPLGI